MTQQQFVRRSLSLDPGLVLHLALHQQDGASFMSCVMPMDIWRPVMVLSGRRRAENLTVWMITLKSPTIMP